MRRTTDRRPVCSRGIEPLAHQVQTRVAVNVLCLTFGNPSSKFWLTPGLRPVRFDQPAKLRCPLTTAPASENFACKRQDTVHCAGQSYRESRASWQRFSGKGTGIRAIRPLTAPYSVHSSKLVAGAKGPKSVLQ